MLIRRQIINLHKLILLIHSHNLLGKHHFLFSYQNLFLTKQIKKLHLLLILYNNNLDFLHVFLWKIQLKIKWNLILKEY